MKLNIFFKRLGSIIQQFEAKIYKGFIPEHNAIYFTVL